MLRRKPRSRQKKPAIKLNNSAKMLRKVQLMPRNKLRNKLIKQDKKPASLVNKQVRQ